MILITFVQGQHFVFLTAGFALVVLSDCYDVFGPSLTFYIPLYQRCILSIFCFNLLSDSEFGVMYIMTLDYSKDSQLCWNLDFHCDLPS